MQKSYCPDRCAVQPLQQLELGFLQVEKGDLQWIEGPMMASLYNLVVLPHVKPAGRVNTRK